jgi:hypothetical protein
LTIFFFQGQFNLLFHSVVEGSLDAFELLIETGADGSLANRYGTHVLMLLAKRNLTSWGDVLVSKLSDEAALTLVNKPVKFGNQSSHL